MERSFVAVSFKAILKLNFSIHIENEQSFSFSKNGQTMLMPHLTIKMLSNKMLSIALECPVTAVALGGNHGVVQGRNRYRQ